MNDQTTHAGHNGCYVAIKKKFHSISICFWLKIMNLKFYDKVVYINKPEKHGQSRSHKFE